MKVLVVSAYFASHRGGVELVAAAMARALAGSGCKVSLLATAVSPAPTPLDLEGQTYPVAASNFTERRLGFPWPAPGPRAFRQVLAAVAENDVVIAHDALYATTVLAYIACRLRRRPLLIVQHVGEVPYKSWAVRWTMRVANALIARPLLASADQVVFISRTTAAHFAGVGYRRPPGYIFNGVDHAVFRPPASAAEKAELRRELRLPPDRAIALFVGRFVEKKGLDLMARLASARPHVFFAFAGWGPKDPDLWKAPNVAVFRDRAGASLAALYRAADALVLPSVGEGFPLVVQEALACGLPVVCGAETTWADPAATIHLAGVDVSGPSEHVTARLAEVLDATLAAPPAQALDRAAFARRRYSWETGAARYVELLERMRSGGASHGPGADPHPNAS